MPLICSLKNFFKNPSEQEVRGRFGGQKQLIRAPSSRPLPASLEAAEVADKRSTKHLPEVGGASDAIAWRSPQIAARPQLWLATAVSPQEQSWSE